MLTRLEARDVKPYTKTVAAQDLREGRVYFSLTFDDEMLIRRYRRLVFGWDLEPSDHDQVLFPRH